MAKKEDDSKEEGKIALGEYVENIVKTAKKAIETKRCKISLFKKEYVWV